jgi:hypothetical protein
MPRKPLIAAVTLVAALGVAVYGVRLEAQERGQPPRPAAGGHHQAFEQCAKACNDCQRICDMCATHCAELVAEGRKEHLKTLQTCRDCATFCSSAAEIVARMGPFSDLICQACAEACARCGKACEQFAQDKMMKQCAEECRRCERACREMLKHTGGGQRTAR